MKWPNDVLVDGAKIAGVLAKLVDAGRAGGAVVAGIGLNVAQAPAALPYAATCLRDNCGTAPAVETVAESVLEALAARWTEWLRDGFGPIRESWRQRGPVYGAGLRVSLPGGTVAGTFEDLDRDGALVLRTGNGTRRIVAGDVVALSA